MKLTRSELKSLIKECLVEIFQESFSSKNDLSEKRIFQHDKPKTTIKHHLNNDIPVKSGPKSIMEELLADTAQTTLRAQNSAESRGSRSVGYQDKMSQIVDQTSPEELFGGESASKWEKLAFFDEKNK